MLDTLVKEKVNPILDIIAQKLDALGIGPNQITIYGFIVGFVGCIAVGVQSYNFALFLIILNRLADGLDGAVARYNDEKPEGKTLVQKLYGQYLDVTLDKIFFAAFVCFYLMGQPHHGIAAATVLFAYVALFSTSMGTYILGTEETSKKKPFYHPTRLIEETEITIFMVLVCLYPIAFSAIAALFSILCLATTFSRFWFNYIDTRRD